LVALPRSIYRIEYTDVDEKSARPYVSQAATPLIPNFEQRYRHCVLTIRAMTGGEGYAQRHLRQSDYYDQNRTVEGRWHGGGAELLGLKGEVASEDFEAVRQGLDPQTGEFLRQRHGTDNRPPAAQPNNRPEPSRSEPPQQQKAPSTSERPEPRRTPSPTETRPAPKQQQEQKPRTPEEKKRQQDQQKPQG
jgi:hypothetical protein